MTTWVCPSCHTCVEAIATEVGHRCPAKKSRWVAFKRVDVSTVVDTLEAVQS